MGEQPRAQLAGSQAPWGLHEFSDLVPQSLASDEQPGGEVGVQASILEPLDARNGRRDGFVQHEEVVYVYMASGLAGCVDDPVDDVQPVDCSKHVSSMFQSPPSNPKSFDRFEAGCRLLGGVHVGFREAFAIFEVNIEDVDAAFARTVLRG